MSAHCNSMLQCLAVCCSVLQRVKMCCSAVQCVTVCCINICVAWQYYVLSFSFIASVDTTCVVCLHRVDSCVDTRHKCVYTVRHTRTHMSTYAISAMYICIILQHTATCVAIYGTLITIYGTQISCAIRFSSALTRHEPELSLVTNQSSHSMAHRFRVRFDFFSMYTCHLCIHVISLSISSMYPCHLCIHLIYVYTSSMYTCLSLFCNLWHIEFVCDMCGNLWHIEGHAMYAISAIDMATEVL